jgi:hypothetical protein
MKTNDEELKRAYRSHVLSRVAPGRDACPSSEDIWRLFGKTGSNKRKTRLLDHVTNCSACFREFEAFLEIFRAERHFIGDVGNHLIFERARSRTRPVWKYAFVPITILIVIASILVTTKWLDLAKKREERGRTAGQLHLLLPSPRKATRPPLIFRWEEIPQADYYTLEIFDDSLLPFWKSPRIDGSSFQVPAMIDNGMPKNRKYFWVLTAYLKNGTRVESSLEEFRFVQ